MPRELVLECIRVATQAPAGGNMQRWRWVVVDDPEQRAGIAELYRRAYEPYIDVQKQAVEKAGRTDSSTTGIIDSLRPTWPSTSQRGAGARHPLRRSTGSRAGPSRA